MPLPTKALSILLYCMIAIPAVALGQEQVNLRLNAVVDARASNADGIPILAITPGGAAQRMGLAAGDRIISINGKSMTGSTGAARAINDALLTSGQNASITLTRGSETLVLQGILASSKQTTNPTGCGFISVTDRPAHLSQNVFSADITQIDGRSVPLDRANRHELSAGDHVLVIREAIPSRWLSINQQHERALMHRRLQAKAYKAFVIKVEPNTRYSIGAKLLRDRMSSEDMHANTYWEPVIYATRDESCR